MTIKQLTFTEDQYTRHAAETDGLTALQALGIDPDTIAEPYEDLQLRIFEAHRDGHNTITYTITTKPTLYLDRDQIIAAIEAGDNCNGSRVLAVAPDGSDHKVCFLQTNRQWDPYPDGWEVIEIPALDPNGSGQGSEDAEDMLRSVLSPEAFHAAEDRQETGDIGWTDLAEELAPEDWSYNRRESACWLADAFLQACNGDGTELNRPHPWTEAGYTNDGDGGPRIIEPPATFEWQAKTA